MCDKAGGEIQPELDLFVLWPGEIASTPSEQHTGTMELQRSGPFRGRITRGSASVSNALASRPAGSERFPPGAVRLQ